MAHKTSILYVDDDFDSCQLIPIFLSHGGDYEVTAMEDPLKASKVIDQKDFDLYLLDYCMPEMTGVMLCKQIREKHPDTPIVMYSALDREVDREQAEKAGVDLFLIKPDEIAELIPNIEKLLHNKQLLSTLSP